MHIARIARHMDPDEIDMELSEIDKRILEILEEGRCTRQHLAERLDVTGQYIYQRVDILLKLGVVVKIHDGFYELAAEYQEGGDKPDSAIETASVEATDGQRNGSAPDRPTSEREVEGAVDDGPDEKSAGDGSEIAVPEDMPKKIDEDEARQAIEATVALLQEKGAASQLEVTKAIMPDYPLTYDVDDALARLQDPEKRNRTTWWRNAIQPALKAHPAIEKPDSSEQEWEWIEK